MMKIIAIKFHKPFILECIFANKERRLFNLEEVFDRKAKYVNKLFNPAIFEQAKIGMFGQVYWEGIAEIRDLNGKLEPCEYDMSAEFIYHNSVLA